MVLHPFFEDAIYDTSIVYNPTPHNIHLSGCQATVSFVGSGLGLFCLFFILGGIHIELMKEIKGEGEEGEKKEKKHHWGATRSAFATSMHIPVVADNNDDEDEDDNDSKSGENGRTF